MTGSQAKVTTEDLAAAIRMMASFPWEEMLEVQRSLEGTIRDGAREREALVAAIRDSAATGGEAPDLAARAEEITRALDAAVKLQERSAAGTTSIAGRLSSWDSCMKHIYHDTHIIRWRVGLLCMIMSLILVAVGAPEILRHFQVLT